MLRPRAGRVLEDLRDIKETGVNHVLSLLEPDEADALGLREEADIATALGLKFLNFPIKDMTLPEPSGFEKLLRSLHLNMKNAAHIAVHCRASIGRSGIVATGILGLLGVDGAEAIARISDARGLDVPDTPEQSAFIVELNERLLARQHS